MSHRALLIACALTSGLVTATLLAPRAGAQDPAPRPANDRTNPLPQEARSSASRADEQMKAVLTSLGELDPKPIETLSPEDARRQPTPADAVKRLMKQRDVEPPADNVEDVDSVTLDGSAPQGARDVKARVYYPKGDGPFPVVVYFHGGGWVLATPEVYDASARAICSMANAVVVSVDYRLAPENKFPAAHDDAYAATQWVLKNAEKFKGDPRRVAVAGESAGGNLAASVCLMARERGGMLPVHQVLIYPVAGHDFDTPSYRENAAAKPLNRPMMEWFFGHYLPNSTDADNKFVSLLKASDEDLRGLPPATVITAEIDPLRSEGQAYADRLRRAGVAVESRDYEGVTHEFFGMSAVLDKAKDAQQFVAERLRDGLAAK